jgi:non-ribosomal peptide synthetase component F
LYGFLPTDRVHQGMSSAFDYSFEEIWVPLLSGSTLVPAPDGAPLLGEDLRDHLQEHRVTALACVPTVLATIPPPLDALRLVLVSGEACPRDVIDPWFAPGRRILNL